MAKKKPGRKPKSTLGTIKCLEPRDETYVYHVQSKDQLIEVIARSVYIDGPALIFSTKLPDGHERIEAIFTDWTHVNRHIAVQAVDLPKDWGKVI